jgi:hypothetical protein
MAAVAALAATAGKLVRTCSREKVLKFSLGLNHISHCQLSPYILPHCGPASVFGRLHFQ